MLQHGNKLYSLQLKSTTDNVFHNLQTCNVDKNDQLSEVSYLGHNIQSETEHEWITPLLSYQAVLLARRQNYSLWCPVIKYMLLTLYQATNSENDCTTDYRMWCEDWWRVPPPQSCNQPENRPTEHANLVRVKICHRTHRWYSSPSRSVIVKRVQNIILRSIIIKHSINSLQVGTHTCP